LEDAERRLNARKADGEMNCEQLRRMANDAMERTLSAKLEAQERKKAISRVFAEEEAERLRRMQEHSILTVTNSHSSVIFYLQ
jgi:hypothetical protein